MSEKMRKLALRYLNNQSSAKEGRIVLKWFDTNEGKRFLKEHIDREISSLEESVIFVPDEHIDTHRILFEIKDKINHGSTISTQATPVSETRSPRFKWYTVAASIAFLVLSVLAYQFSGADRVTFETSFGETRTVTLPDRSTVTLNGNSKLSYEKEWDETREVWVDGEAYFSVTHTANNDKFIVHSSDELDVEVLGTEFTVNTRSDKSRVVLNNGKIRVVITGKEGETPIMMVPGDLVEYDEEPKRLVKQQVNPEVYSSWKTNKLIFDKTSIGEIVERLEQTYGLDVIVEDADLLKEKFSGSVPNDNMDILLEGLSKLFNLRIAQQDEKIRIERN